MSESLPKMFCLTLKDTPKRKEYAKQHFEKNNLDVEFFDGINGAKFGLRTIIPFKDDNPDGPDWFITPGRIGCLLSHYMLWQTLWHLPHEEIIIFEDDIVLCENFQERFFQAKSQLPNDWQYVFIGHCCLPPEEYQIKISENVITNIHSPMCTHAYMIKKSSIPVLLETNHQAWAAVDIQIQKRSLKILKHYVFLPSLVEQVSLLKQRYPEKGIDSENVFNSLTLN